MKRFLLYFSPTIILLAGVIAGRYNVTMQNIETVVLVTKVLYPLILLSVYWAVGYWTPGQIGRTVISVVMGVVLLSFIAVLFTIFNGLYLVVLTPFLLFGLIMTSRHFK